MHGMPATFVILVGCAGISCRTLYAQRLDEDYLPSSHGEQNMMISKYYRRVTCLTTCRVKLSRSYVHSAPGPGRTLVRLIAVIKILAVLTAFRSQAHQPDARKETKQRCTYDFTSESTTEIASACQVWSMMCGHAFRTR